MWRMLAKSLWLGVATTPYPAAPEAAATRGRPTLDATRCQGSGDCVRSCPTGAIRLDDDPADGTRRWHVDLGACVFCGVCAQACASQAIALVPGVELSVRDRAALLQTIAQEAK